MARHPENLESVLTQLAREGELYEPLPESRVRCYACGHRCLILPGQRGVCKVRWNEGGRLMVPWGYVAGLQLDPVEKKPFFHAYPGARALSFGMLGCDYHCGYCFRGDTPVLTPTGAISIQKIFDEAGPGLALPDGEIRFPRDVRVVTPSGGVAVATKAFRHAYRGPMAVIKPMYFPQVHCTPDHRWLAATAAGGPIHEVRTCDLTPQHLLIVPRPLPTGSENVTLDVVETLKHLTTTFAIPRSLSPSEVTAIMEASAAGESSRQIGARLGKHPSYIRHVRSKVVRGRWVYERTQGLLVEGDRIRFPNERRPGIPRHVPLDKMLARLFGFYCAEGSISQCEGRPNSFGLGFSFGHNETAARSEVKESLETVFGVRVCEVRRSTTTALAVGKSSLALFFAALCGKGAAAKRVPSQIFAADPAIQQAFLDAYVVGDGHEYRGGKLTITTVSRDMAHGVAWLALRLGYFPSIYRSDVGPEGVIQGRPVHRAPEQFSVVWYRGRRGAIKFHENESHFLVPVKAVTTVLFDGDVFNLEVAGEHAYVAGFCGVRNCQNSLTSQALRDPMAGVRPLEITPEQIVDVAMRERARILTSTYNEPLITSEWAVDVFRLAKPRGLVCSYVSNGNATPGVLDYLRPWVDLYKVDLKSFDDRHYRKLGGLLTTVLDSIRRIHALGFWLEVVTLVIPGFNDSDAELRDIAGFLRSVSPDIPWHVTAFHRDYKMTDRDDTTAATLVRAAEIGCAEGLRYVYAGNLPGRVGPFENTRCPGCGALLIERVGYRIVRDVLTRASGQCPHCATRVPGVWS